MVFTFQLTPITLLAPLALLLLLICWLATRHYGGGPGDAIATVAVYIGALLVWLFAAVVVLGFHYFIR